MLMVNLMFIQSHLKLEKKDYCIGVVNKLKKTFLLTQQINV